MPSVYSTKYNDPILINDHTLIKFSYPTNQNADFHQISYIPLGGNGYHYIEVDSVSINQQNQIESFSSEIRNVVWDRGISEYQHKLNYNYVSGYLIQPDASTILRDLNFIQVEFFIPQLFNWSETYGILVSIKGTTTGDIYVNKILRVSDFTISSDRAVMYGTQWVECHTFKIPATDEELYIQTTVIKNDEISVLGYIYNYPNQYVPLIQNKPLPDFIVTELYFDSLNFLHICPKTLENKTLENSLKDYFGYQTDKIINISISHIITWEGTIVATGVYQNNVMRVSNEENPFNECVVGLNFQDWIDVNNPEQTFTIQVRTEINVDGKLMNRYTSITTDFSTEIIRLKNLIENPSSVIYENIEEVNNITQTVIEKPIETKIVKVYQPVFVKFIEDLIEYSRTNISFTQLTEPAYMKVGEDMIQSSVTSDGTYYFDLSKLTPIKEETEYQIITISSETIIGQGIIKPA